jgi:hypothetical protein
VYREYKDKIKFIPVYIREAHPIDGWWIGFSITRKIIEKRFPKAALDVYDPQTIEERRQVADRCEKSLEYGIRTYVDEMDNHVSEAYAGWPTRLFLVGTNGKIVYRGGLGPWGFKPAELSKAIEEYLAN